MKRIILINAIVWASIILLTSWFFKDSEHYKFLFLLPILGFTISNGLISLKNKKIDKTKKCN